MARTPEEKARRQADKAALAAVISQLTMIYFSEPTDKAKYLAAALALEEAARRMRERAA